MIVARMAGRKRVRNPASKEMILDAAERVVMQQGPGHMTLEAVAREAGLSKGGLLYNFPSKQSLIQGMILGHVERHRCRYEELRAARADEPNSAICALIECRKAAGIERGVGLAMLAGLAENPELLSPFREELRKTLTEIRENATDPMVATLVWLAIDGLEFLELLDISPFDDKEREKIESQLTGFIESGCGAASEAKDGSR